MADRLMSYLIICVFLIIDSISSQKISGFYNIYNNIDVNSVAFKYALEKLK